MNANGESPDLRLYNADGPPKRVPLVTNAVLGVSIFILTEAMLFTGFISGFIIIKANASGVWPPPDQPRLPIEMTAVNSAILLLSGILLWAAARQLKQQHANGSRLFLASVVLGCVFVAIQGYEWIQLIGEGLTLTSSSYGSFFYMIVGMHALHALAGLTALTNMYRYHRAGTHTEDGFQATRIFWYFVVGLWPVLYWQVYL